MEWWDCPICTLINEPGAKICSACGNPNPNAAASSLKLSIDSPSMAAKEACDKIWSESTLKVLAQLVGNAADHPEEPKYRGPISKDKEKIKAAIASVPEAVQLMHEAGFEEDDSCFVIRTPDIEKLKRVQRLIRERQSVVNASEVAKKTSTVAPQGGLYVRRKEKFDPQILQEIEERERDRREAREFKVRALESASTGTAVGVVGQPMTLTSLQSGFMRVRLRLSMGGQMDLTVDSSETVGGFLDMLRARTGIPKVHQQIRFGFPPVKIQGSSDGHAKLLLEVGMHDGEVVHLENLNDLFINKLESGSVPMQQLLKELPPRQGADPSEDSGMLFIEALELFDIDLEACDFWAVVQSKLQNFLSGDCENPEGLKSGLSLLRRLFKNYDPRQRVDIVLQAVFNQYGQDEMPAEIHLQCDRQNLFDSVTSEFLRFNQRELLSCMLVEFKNEPGVDGGGLTRDMFGEFAQRLADGQPLLWNLTSRGSLQPIAGVVSEPASHSSGFSSAELYRACGRIFASAVLHDCTLGRQLSRSFVRLLVGDPPIELSDLQEELNHEAGEEEFDFRGSRQFVEQSLAQSGLEGLLKFTFEISHNQEVREVELVPGGASNIVTDETKLHWLTTLLSYKLVLSQEFAASHFRNGIIDVFGGSDGICPLLSILTPDELVELWGGHGVQKEDVDNWKKVTNVSPYVACQAEWFWQVLREDFDDDLRSKVLRFATGSSRIGREGIEEFSIEPADGGDERLPSAMTCANMLQLPRYSSRFALERQLRIAVETCTTFQHM